MKNNKLYPARLTQIMVSLALLISPINTLLAADDLQAPLMAGKPHGQRDPHASLGVDQLITVALQHRQEARYPQALEVLAEAIYRYPDNAELFSIRGSIQLELNRLSAALQDLEQAAKLKPDDAVIRVNRAQAYKGFGRQQDALSDLEDAVKLDPSLIAARFSRGAIYHSLGQYDKALADFEHCIALDPHSDAPYFNRASTYEALGKRENAIADFRRFIELSSNENWKQTAQQLIEKLETQKTKNDNKNEKENAG